MPRGTKKGKKGTPYHELVNENGEVIEQSTNSEHIKKLSILHKEFPEFDPDTIGQILKCNKDNVENARFKIYEMKFGNDEIKIENPKSVAPENEVKSSQPNLQIYEEESKENSLGECESTLLMWDNEMEQNIDNDIISEEIAENFIEQFPDFELEDILKVVKDCNNDISKIEQNLQKEIILLRKKINEFENDYDAHSDIAYFLDKERHNEINRDFLRQQIKENMSNKSKAKQVKKKVQLKDLDFKTAFPENKRLTEGKQVDPFELKKKREMQISEIKKSFPILDRSIIELYVPEDGGNLMEIVAFLKAEYPKNYVISQLLPEQKSAEQFRIVPGIGKKKKNYKFSNMSQEGQNTGIVSRMNAEISYRAMKLYMNAAKVDLKNKNYDSYYRNKEKADEYKSEFYRLNHEASESIFKYNNSNRNKYEIDLHGLYSGEAIEILDSRLNEISQSLGNKEKITVLIITGKGNHSKSTPVLKNKVQDYLHEQNYKYSIQKENSGVLIVHL